MKSKAQVKSHPIHPMLIPFPIAFLVSAFVLDGAGWLYDSTFLATVGSYAALAGIVTGLIAAVPGFIDYLTIVPPKSSGKERATKHGLVNVGALLAFAIVLIVREGMEVPIGPLLLVIQLLGLGLLASGGWMGGTLVYRNQIGVDHRYAGAGKWNEEHVEHGSEATQLGTTDELEVDQMKLVHVNGRRIVLARTEEGFVAFDDHCSHRGASLADGSMICGTVQCPWHGSQFDVRTGAVEAGPAEHAIQTFHVEERDGHLWARL